MIVDTVIINQILARYSTPCFCAELSSGTTNSSVCWTRLILQRGANWCLLRKLLPTKKIIKQSTTPCFWEELTSDKTHCYVCCNMLIDHRGVNYWFLRHLLSIKYSPDLPPHIFARNYHQAQPTVLSVGIGSYFIDKSIDNSQYETMGGRG